MTTCAMMLVGGYYSVWNTHTHTTAKERVWCQVKKVYAHTMDLLHGMWWDWQISLFIIRRDQRSMEWERGKDW